MQKIHFVILLAAGLLVGDALSAQAFDPGLFPGKARPLPGKGGSLPGKGTLLPGKGEQLPGWTGPLSGKKLLGDSLHLSPLPSPPDLRGLLKFNGKSAESTLHYLDEVRIMAPDAMGCRMTDLSRMERMPVMKLQNKRPRDPMPNSLTPPPAIVQPGRLRPVE